MITDIGVKHATLGAHHALLGLIKRNAQHVLLHIKFIQQLLQFADYLAHNLVVWNAKKLRLKITHFA